MTIQATLPATTPGEGESLLSSMVNCMSQGNPIYLPSKFWEVLNSKNLNQLESEGVENFKQTVAQNYFTWVIGRWDTQFKYLVEHTKPQAWPSILLAGPSILYDAWRRDVSPRLSRRQQVELSVFTKMLWKLAEQFDEYKLLKRLEEPAEGNPFRIFLGGKLISQDLANSVLEFYSIKEHFAPPLDAKVRICELGAGYGRNAYVFTNAFPNGKYVIIDIPPALYVSQRYLTNVFPDKRVFKFRCFENFEEVREEFEAASIAFLLPHQAEMLPAKSVDLFVNISSLHEMTMEQISAYFGLIDRLTKGYFYSKQWFVSENEHDGICVKKDDYPILGNWRELYLRPARVQTHFFEAMYAVQPAGAGRPAEDSTEGAKR